MKKLTKQLMCAALILVIVLSFAACGTPGVDGGLWCKEGNPDMGYRFRELQETVDGREMGLVERIGRSNPILTSYYYYFSGENQITIVERVTRITSNTVREEVYDVLQLTETDGQRVMVSQNSDASYLYRES